MKAEIHQKKRNLRQRLIDVIRRLAVLQKHSKHKQLLLDLTCNVDLTGPIDQAKLPVNPDGFLVRATAQQRHRGIANATVCQLQVVSMAVLYYWLYCSIQDAQDSRSCERYLDWLEAYLKAPEKYAVIQDRNLNWYLYPLKGTPENKPHPPEWLEENDGETV